jgi:transposase-like protein
VPRTRPPYPPEFRREAIELVRISSRSQHQIAEDLGISDVTLRNWVKQAERDEGKRPDGLSSDEREEPLVRAAALADSFNVARSHLLPLPVLPERRLPAD